MVGSSIFHYSISYTNLSPKGSDGELTAVCSLMLDPVWINLMGGWDSLLSWGYLNSQLSQPWKSWETSLAKSAGQIMPGGSTRLLSKGVFIHSMQIMVATMGYICCCAWPTNKQADSRGWIAEVYCESVPLDFCHAVFTNYSKCSKDIRWLILAIKLFMLVAWRG